MLGILPELVRLKILLKLIKEILFRFQLYSKNIVDFVVATLIEIINQKSSFPILNTAMEIRLQTISIL